MKEHQFPLPNGDCFLKDFSPLVFSSGSVVRFQDGRVIYQRLDGTCEELAESGDLCGVGLFETGVDDIFVDCCGWHDRSYKNRKFFEEQGWDRQAIDDYFLDLMLYVASNESEAWKRLRYRIRAQEYHFLARNFGALVYYKHPAGELLMATAQLQRTMHSLMGELIKDDVITDYFLNAPLSGKASKLVPFSPAARAAENLKAADPKLFVVAYLDTDNKIALSAEGDSFTNQVGLLTRASFLMNMHHDGFIEEEPK